MAAVDRELQSILIRHRYGGEHALRTDEAMVEIKKLFVSKGVA